MNVENLGRQFLARVIGVLVCLIAIVGLLLWLSPKFESLNKAADQANKRQQLLASPTPTPHVKASPTTAIRATEPPQPQHTLLSAKDEAQTQQTLLWLLAGSVGLCLALVVLGGWSRGLGGRQRKTHGSAQFADGSTLRAFRPTLVEWLRRSQPPRLIIGRARGGLISLSQSQQEQNVLLTAPVGSGKSSGIIIPNILREQGKRSLFMPDVKGELFKRTSGAVSRYHEVWLFAPDRPKESMGYNPLAHVRGVADAQDLAHCWMVNTGTGSGSDSAFWANAAKKLITATILHLRAAEPHAPFVRLADLLSHTPFPQLQEILSESPSSVAAREAKPFFAALEENEKMEGSIAADLQTRFSGLLSDEVRAATATNDLDFAAMAERPIALYLSIPRRGMERLQPLTACLTMQMFAAWERRAEEEPDGRLPVSIMAYMDEFCNLGYIPSFDGIISTARASGVAMLLAIQSFSQLDNRYGPKTRNIIMSNTVTHLLLPGAGQEECEFYSGRIGSTTTRTESYSTSERGARGGSAGQHSEGESARRLMTADEVRTMKHGTILMVPGAYAPIILKALPYYRDKRLYALAGLSQPQRPPRQEPEPPKAEPSEAPTAIMTDTEPEPERKRDQGREEEEFERFKQLAGEEEEFERFRQLASEE